MKKIKKYILPAIPAVILTFILSKILNPMFEFLYSVFLKIGSFFISSFSDSTYKSISNGYSEKPSLTVLYYTSLIIMVILFMFISWRNYVHMDLIISISKLKEKCNKSIQQDSISDTKTDYNDILSELAATSKELENFQNNVNASYKKYSIILIFLSTILVFLLIFFYGQQVFINNSITKILSNIEIVSPYISDTEYKYLRSTFYSISNKEDYESLLYTLEEIADANSISLKE